MDIDAALNPTYDQFKHVDTDELSDFFRYRLVADWANHFKDPDRHGHTELRFMIQRASWPRYDNNPQFCWKLVQQLPDVERKNWGQLVADGADPLRTLIDICLRLWFQENAPEDE